MIPIIDAHTHGDWRSAELPECRKLWAAQGIEKVAIIEKPSRLPDEADCPADIIPIQRIHLSGAFDLGTTKAVKVIAPDAPLSSEGYMDAYARLAAAGRTLVLHTGWLDCREAEWRTVPMEYMAPWHVDFIAKRNPTLNIVMAHAGNPWWDVAWKVAWSNPNVYFDLSGGTAFRLSWDDWVRRLAPSRRVAEQTFRKLLFASDKAATTLAGCHLLSEYLAFYRHLILKANIPYEIERLVWYGNAEWLLLPVARRRDDRAELADVPQKRP